MSFVSLEDDSSVDSESECFWNDTSISHHLGQNNENSLENKNLSKKFRVKKTRENVGVLSKLNFWTKI